MNCLKTITIITRSKPIFSPIKHDLSSLPPLLILFCWVLSVVEKWFYLMLIAVWILVIIQIPPFRNNVLHCCCCCGVTGDGWDKKWWWQQTWEIEVDCYYFCCCWLLGLAVLLLLHSWLRLIVESLSCTCPFWKYVQNCRKKSSYGYYSHCFCCGVYCSLFLFFVVYCGLLILFFDHYVIIVVVQSLALLLVVAWFYCAQ